jgi:hypothetical protein
MPALVIGSFAIGMFATMAVLSIVRRRDAMSDLARVVWAAVIMTIGLIGSPGLLLSYGPTFRNRPMGMLLRNVGGSPGVLAAQHSNEKPIADVKVPFAFLGRAEAIGAYPGTILASMYTFSGATGPLRSSAAHIPLAATLGEAAVIGGAGGAANGSSSCCK